MTDVTPAPVDQAVEIRQAFERAVAIDPRCDCEVSVLAVAIKVATGREQVSRQEIERLKAELTEAERSANVWRELAERWDRDHTNTVLPYTSKIEDERDEKQRLIDNALQLHCKFKIYDECGHRHEMPAGPMLPEGLHLIEDVGLVCDEGYQYSICVECCTGGSGEYQTELCASEHRHGDTVCWPCPTRAALSGVSETPEATR